MCVVLVVVLAGTGSAVAAARHRAAPAGADAKRVLASRLIRSADVHKDRSLRDVLSGRHAPLEEGTIKVAPKEAPQERPRTLSELFAWAIRATTAVQEPSNAMLRTGEEPIVDNVVRTAAEEEAYDTYGATEAESLAAGIRSLSDIREGVRVRALLVLEELCHSVDNGRDLAEGNGVTRIVRALHATEARVRASAAWALATCAQNNPAVQRVGVELDAVPSLARLAAYDRDGVVRARALFALNAVLELADARAAFEHEAAAIPAVRRALQRNTPTRAVRRALNLAELLVGKNVDVWKTILEAWDMPPLIERLMREHADNDVRESAARVIAALDGRVLA